MKWVYRPELEPISLIWSYETQWVYRPKLKAIGLIWSYGAIGLQT